MNQIARLLVGLALAGVLAAGLFAAADTRAALDRVLVLLDWLRGAGPLSWLAFVLTQAAVATLGVLPASLLGIAAGMAYGLWGGFALAALGTLLGGWIAFRLSRSLFRPWIAGVVGRHASTDRFDRALSAGNWRFVCLMRISPIMPFSITSYALGLTRIDERSYLLGTLASIPALFVYVAAGAFAKAGLKAAIGEMNLAHVVLLGVGVAATLGMTLYLRRALAGALREQEPALPAAS